MIILKVIAVVVAAIAAIVLYFILGGVLLFYLGKAASSRTLEKLFAAIEDRTFFDVYEECIGSELKAFVQRSLYPDIAACLERDLGLFQSKKCTALDVRSGYVRAVYNVRFAKEFATVEIAFGREGSKLCVVRFHLDSPVCEFHHSRDRFAFLRKNQP